MVATTVSVAVISVGNGERGGTYAVGLESRKATWHNGRVAAAAVIRDTAVAVTSKDSVRQQVVGLDINHDGRQKWSKPPRCARSRAR
ncbi:hypothetical protein [Streptomyces lydicus]|uniref:hypothetical protein n=1 Tax=Streptomyces lydicus TaxID=47763 RepID=UPI0036E04B50